VADEDAGEKTEDATDRRREEYRERGQLARSQDVMSLVSLASGLAYFIFFGPFVYERMSLMFVSFFGGALPYESSLHQMMTIGLRATLEMLYMIFPILVGALLFGVLGNVLQIGVLFTTKTLEPKFEKLNFFANFFPAFFNKRAIGTLATSLTKMFFILLVVYYTLQDDTRKIAHLSMIPIEAGIAYVVDRLLVVLFNIVLIMVVIAIIDYSWQVWMMEEEMKMSKQEVKEEYKMSDGNPQIKSQRRKRALEMLNQRMMTEVPKADVVINNPTHFSVALRYRQGQDVAPVVVAKGADLLALRIRRLAEQHDVVMVDNPVLARALYKQVKVGRSVPVEFYRAVAEVLYYVYRLRHGSRLLAQNGLSRSLS